MQDTTFTYALISLKNDVCLQNKCIGSRIVERIPHKLLQHKGCRTFFEISALDLLVTAPLPALDQLNIINEMDKVIKVVLKNAMKLQNSISLLQL